MVDTVRIEPVSASKFPASREKNRERCKSGPPEAIFAHSRPANSVPCSKIPTQWSREFFGRMDCNPGNGQAGNREYAYAGWAMEGGYVHPPNFHNRLHASGLPGISGRCIAQRTGRRRHEVARNLIRLGRQVPSWRVRVRLRSDARFLRGFAKHTIAREARSPIDIAIP